jgi:putative peptidoglycan lipid II flippase
MSEHKALFKSAGVLSFFTVISRITGFLRDVLMANVFGTGVAAQAFFVAFKIPNMLRDVIGEGAGNAAFVPVFCEYLAHRSKEDFLKLVNSLFIFVVSISAGIVVLGILFASPLIRMIAPGFIGDSAKFHLTVDLTRLLFPYLVLISVSAYLMSISNALKSFAVPALSSTVFNLFLIVAIFFIGKTSVDEPVIFLGFAVLLAGVTQVLVQGPSLLRQGVDFRSAGLYAHPFRNESIRKVGRLIVPRVVGSSIYQLNIFIDTIFASFSYFVGDGAIAAIYYANRIIQLPFSVIGVALSNAALPTLSAHASRQDMDKFKATLNFSLKAVFLCMVPLMSAILVFAAPLVRAVFERGRFDASSSALTSEAVFFYAWGLIGYVGVRFLSLGFYALQDTLTPVKTSSLALAMNVFLNVLFIFVFHLRLAGLALASSISATVNFIILYHLMKRRTGFKFNADFGGLMMKAALASGITVVACWAAGHRIFGGVSSLASLAGLLCMGTFIYFGLLWAGQVAELKELVRWLRKKI